MGDPEERDGLARLMDAVIVPEIGEYDAALMASYHAAAEFGICARAFWADPDNKKMEGVAQTALEKFNGRIINVQRTRDALTTKIAKHFRKNG